MRRGVFRRRIRRGWVVDMQPQSRNLSRCTATGLDVGTTSEVGVVDQVSGIAVRLEASSMGLKESWA